MNTKTTPKDFFLNLGATIALYIAVGYFINLAFSIINYLNPDELAGYYYGSFIAWPISMLIVLVPIIYILEWLINRDIKNIPEKREIWIRKWRIFLTLFLAVILLAGDLIYLINTYLSGEITSRFIYKILVILLVSGLVGKYYFFSLYPTFKVFGNSNWSQIALKVNAYMGILLVLVTIVGGFVIVGSPTKQRDIRFDTQRVNDLSSIQSLIIYNYWPAKGTVPNNLDELNDPTYYDFVATDPETKEKYVYNKLSSNSFELCATFAQVTQDTKGRGAFDGGSSVAYPASYPRPESENNMWEHGIGRTCFTRTIDKDLHPVNPTRLEKL